MKEPNPEISPCCNAKALLSARFMNREAWRCTKCEKFNAYQINRD